MLKLLFFVAVATALLVIFSVGFSVNVNAQEPPPSKLIRVRLGNLEAVTPVSGAATFQLTDQSGIARETTSEFSAAAGESLEDLKATFTYQGNFRWKIHITDEEGEQLTLLEGNYPGYPYAIAEPLSKKLRVASPEDSLVFLDFMAYTLEFEAIAVLREQEGVERVLASAGLDSDGSGAFDPKEVVNTEAKPEGRMIRVFVPRLSSNVNMASFFIRLESKDGDQLANVEGTWSFDGSVSQAFDLESDIKGVSAFYGQPRPARTVSTVALHNPWDLPLVSLPSASDGADFSFIMGRKQEQDMIMAEIGGSEPARTAQAVLTVTSEDGEAVSSAAVAVAGEEYLTDDFGRAAVSAPPGAHEVVVTAEGFDRGSTVLEFVDGETQSSQVSLDSTGTGPLENGKGFMDQHWLTIVIAAVIALLLALLALAMFTPSRNLQLGG